MKSFLVYDRFEGDRCGEYFYDDYHIIKVPHKELHNGFDSKLYKYNYKSKYESQEIIVKQWIEKSRFNIANLDDYFKRKKWTLYNGRSEIVIVPLANNTHNEKSFIEIAYNYPIKSNEYYK